MVEKKNKEIKQSCIKLCGSLIAVCVYEFTLLKLHWPAGGNSSFERRAKDKLKGKGISL